MRGCEKSAKSCWVAGQRGEYHFQHFLRCLYSVSVDDIGILHVRSFGFCFFFSGTVQIFSFMSRKQKKKLKCANIMACKCSNFCSAHSPSPSFCLSAELLFHPHGPGVLAKLSVQVPALLLSKIPSPQDWAQCLVSPGSPAPNRSQELMAAIFLTLREQLLRDVTRRAEACGNQRQSLGLRCSASL